MNLNKFKEGELVKRSKTRKMFEEFGILTMITLLIFGVYIFMAGLHNIDNSWNSYKTSRNIIDFANNQLRINGASFQISLEGQKDIARDYSLNTIEQAYVLGHKQINSGLVLMLISSFFLGILLERKL